MSPTSKQEQFQHWLMDMDDAIQRFIDSLPLDARSKLDGTDVSLEAVEAWLLTQYTSPRDAAAADQATFVDGAARYVGEIFRRRTGSKWGIKFTDPKDVFFGLPTLTGGSIGATPICPLTMVTASTDRRTGNYFATILKNVSPKKVNETR
jgi:hypothetical protein